MRVVAGEARGRRLEAPEGREIRPTSDRVRQSLFDCLGDLADLVVLDLFSGTGALGIEALSRGAARAVFVDQARPAIELTRRNLALVGYTARALCWQMEAAAAVARLGQEGTRLDLALLDPPYADTTIESLLAAPAWAAVLAPGARLVLERDVRAPAPALPAFWERTDVRRYGETELWMLRPVAAKG